jgi:CO dehydrogenase nickel-insertion accessory protein CooC1
MAKIARDLRVKDRWGPVVTLVDLKAGIEDSARGVLTTLDWAIVVVDPTVAAVQVAADLNQMVFGIQAGEVPATHHLQSPGLAELAREFYRNARVKGVLVVLNRVRDSAAEGHLTQMVLGETGLKPVGTLKEDSAIADAWLRGLPVSAGESRRAMARLADALEKTATADLAPAPVATRT